MTKTTEALRIELEDLKNLHYEINENMKRDRTRIDRVVQVLLNNLHDEILSKIVSVNGVDCCGELKYYRDDGYFGDSRITLRQFLAEVIDP